MQSFQPTLTSIIDGGCDIQIAFNRILKYYDPNKGKNRKTKVLDCSNFLIWNENDLQLFDVEKTRNLTGFVATHRYDIILYDPPCNNSFFTATLESSKLFSSVLNIGGVVLVKAKDFKVMNGINNELKGNTDIAIIFNSNNFYLSDQFVYKHNKLDDYKNKNEIQINHSYFMIFKKKIS